MNETRNKFNKDEAKMDKIENHVTQLGSQMKNLETQIEINPKEQCKAIRLRSGTEYEGPKIPENSENSQDGTANGEVEADEGAEEHRAEHKGAEKLKSSSNPDISKLNVPLPFPQRFQKKKLDAQFAKFLDIFKKLHINIPFADALEQMPNYAKFLKDVMSKKWKMTSFQTVNLTEECSAIIQRKLPHKLKESGSFTIPCAIGDVFFKKALCDLGASINLMPLSIFRQLGLGEVKPSTITLQFADRSLTYPKGIIGDILVKVDKFIFPVDFLVLDMEEDKDVPLILGRPFLATGKALIDVQKGQLTLRVNDEHVLFTIYKALQFHDGV
ncbi:hypothetical protein DH2020_044259 [Rehmannia glutinosa]|uniref:Aspartic peptidase DDI1-type domain-containing protein n=1 Tax=Rehmannia glutinosa TaxID=99300 RepID=A0ABR0UHM5_REHGL